MSLIVAETAVNCLKIVFERLKASKVDEFCYPWNNRYSADPQDILIFATTVYQESLSAYQELAERWFKNFTSHLSIFNLFPVAIEGVLILTPEKRHSLEWYWIPLKDGSSNQVKFKLANSPITENEKRSIMNKAEEIRGQFNRFSFYQASPPITKLFPVTHIVYNWLWDDLEKLKLVDGSFSPHIW